MRLLRWIFFGGYNVLQRKLPQISSLGWENLPTESIRAALVKDYHYITICIYLHRSCVLRFSLSWFSYLFIAQELNEIQYKETENNPYWNCALFDVFIVITMRIVASEGWRFFSKPSRPSRRFHRSVVFTIRICHCSFNNLNGQTDGERTDSVVTLSAHVFALMAKIVKMNFASKEVLRLSVSI